MDGELYVFGPTGGFCSLGGSFAVLCVGVIVDRPDLSLYVMLGFVF